MTTNTAHFSIDDVFLPLLNLSQATMTSLFEESFFAFLKELHDKHGLQVTLYCYFEQDGHNLTQVSSAFRDEFIANSDWMKFGYHGKNDSFGYRNSSKETFLNDATIALDELRRIVGKQSLSSTVRLHFYEGNADVVEACRTIGIDTLLSSDEDGLSYDLNEEEVQTLALNQKLTRPTGMTFVKTSLRIETCDDIDSVSISTPYYVFFTHEWALREEDNKIKLRKTVQRVQLLEYSYSFLEEPTFQVRFYFSGQDFKELNKMIAGQRGKLKDRMPSIIILLILDLLLFLLAEMIWLSVLLTAFIILFAFFPNWIALLLSPKSAKQIKDFHSENSIELKNQCFLFHSENEDMKSDYRVDYTEIVRLFENENWFCMVSKRNHVFYIPKAKADEEFFRYLVERLEESALGGTTHA